MRIAVLRDAYCVLRNAACLRSLKEDAGTSTLFEWLLAVAFERKRLGLLSSRIMCHASRFSHHDSRITFHRTPSRSES
jgi:hypothetical protein